MKKDEKEEEEEETGSEACWFDSLRFCCST